MKHRDQPDRPNAAVPATWARAATVVAALVAAALVFSLQLGYLTARSAPDTARQFMPMNADANAYSAKLLLETGAQGEELDTARRLAERALDRSPASAQALETLGLLTLAQGREDAAVAMLEQTSRMSRRQGATQIALIEPAAARGDIDGALARYNAALRVSRSSAGALVPVLVAASGDPLIAPRLADLLAQRPVWRLDFARQLVLTPDPPNAAFLSNLESLQLSAEEPTEREILSAGIERLLAAGRYDAAYAQYRKATPGAPAAPALLRNGRFREDGLAPFDWALERTEETEASIIREDSGAALWVTSQTGDGLAASQALLLPPGRYRAQMQFEHPAGGAAPLAIRVACYGGDTVLGDARGPGSPGTRTLAMDFVVPAGACEGQKLEISVSPTDTGDPVQIRSVAVSAR